jgi:hypothetical protein
MIIIDFLPYISEKYIADSHLDENLKKKLLIMKNFNENIRSLDNTILE